MRVEQDALLSHLELTVLMLGSPPCEARHHDRNPVCSGDVVARFSYTCDPTRTPNICAASYEYAAGCMSDDVTCRYCGALCRDCWSLHLI